MIVQFIFNVSLFIVLYTYIGYPLLLLMLGKIMHKKVNKQEILPQVSILVSAFNEEKNIESKLLNYFELDYPNDKIEIIIGSDGSNDGTNKIIASYLSKGVVFRSFPHRRGKPSVLNDLVSIAKGDIIVFTDARQKIAKNAIRELVSNFFDHQVGCVSGELIFMQEGSSDVGNAMGLYWNYEKSIRSLESSLGSMVGATGALYAIRKKLYAVVPSNLLLDDVFIPLKVVGTGYRAVFDASAKVYDTVSQTCDQEYTRKIRTLAGNWQLLHMFLFLNNSFDKLFVWQLISHKFLRLLIPLLLFMLIVSNILLVSNYIFRIFAFIQFLFYFMVFVGYVLSKTRNTVSFLKFPYTFFLLNSAILEGFIAFITKSQKVTWKK